MAVERYVRRAGSEDRTAVALQHPRQRERILAEVEALVVILGRTVEEPQPACRRAHSLLYRQRLQVVEVASVQHGLRPLEDLVGDALSRGLAAREAVGETLIGRAERAHDAFAPDHFDGFVG